MDLEVGRLVEAVVVFPSVVSATEVGIGTTRFFDSLSDFLSPLVVINVVVDVSINSEVVDVDMVVSSGTFPPEVESVSISERGENIFSNVTEESGGFSDWLKHFSKILDRIIRIYIFIGYKI